ncbi:MAG: nitrilase-related carbon-nitrogen hydrolase [Solirubrobacteraceae bacterium]
MRVGLAQIDSELGDLAANLDTAAAAIAEARDGGADLVVLPELCLSGYAIGSSPSDVALRADDPALAELASAAGEGSVTICFPELSQGGRLYNSAAYFEAGSLLHVHRKLYLPTYAGFEERKHFSVGSMLRAFDTGLGRTALLICNDAWQPALAFLACQDGAEWLIMPADSAHSNPYDLDVREYWRDITRLYARLFECYVVFVNRVGDECGLRFWGGSHVVDPYGEIVGEAPEDKPAVLVTPDLDPAAVRRRRRTLPLTREARLAMLRREMTRLIDEGGDL